MSQRRAAHLRRQASVDHPRYPPPSAASAQPQPPQHVVQPSDYGSDTPAYLSDYPSQPPPAIRTNEELNLSVLRRYNPKIVSILSIAPYAVVYEFSPLPEPTWSKNGVEGSLFLNMLEKGIYGEDRYSAFVLNRRGMDNFEAELREGDNAGVEITEEYVIISYKEDHEQKINGIFIFSEGPGTSTEHTRTMNGDLMKKLAVQAGLSRKAAVAAASEATAAQTNGHMQEAEAAVDSQMAVPMGRQISLQQLFGQQRADDASFSVRNHSPQSAGQDAPHQDLHTQRYGGSRQAQSIPQPVPHRSEVQIPLAGSGNAQPIIQPSPQQPDILLDLFRNAGMPKI
jgi:hypothetical protein